MTALTALREAIATAHLADEDQCAAHLLPVAEIDARHRARIDHNARALVAAVRESARKRGGLDAFLHQYDLSSQEGVVLMCLAEALLRIPDAHTADRLIRDKLNDADWEKHLGHSHHLFVNASTWGLMLTGRLMELDRNETADLGAFFGRLATRVGEPIIRRAMIEAMRIMGHQFVLGRTIEEALARREDDYRYSFDMLGEAALSAPTAQAYFQSYANAIDQMGGANTQQDIFAAPSISIKLSALHPRFEYAQRARVLAELAPRVVELASQARDRGIGVTLDTEEADRLEITLDVFERVFANPALAGWEGFGLALQAYQKRAFAIVDWLAALARRQGRRMTVRLVKGAYWDTEIKRAQERGLEGYPVFTRKVTTDVSYLACAKKILAQPQAIYPQFATHNAHTLAAVHELAGGAEFEFQRLHGMGEALYEYVAQDPALATPCRVYAPVGSHEDLLPYLVRRLLENGTNTSFVNRIVDEDAPIEEIIADPVRALRALPGAAHPRIPLPARLYGQTRINSRGVDLHDGPRVASLVNALQRGATRSWRATPIIAGEAQTGAERAVASPADHRQQVGTVIDADEKMTEQAIACAAGATHAWAAQDALQRAQILEQAATLLEEHRDELLTLIVREGGRCIPDALSEIREAVDFCRYYGTLAHHDFATPLRLPGPTGESNHLSLHGRGVFACISPWNFPVAIFAGQISAALAAGNAVIAKPAGQSALAGARVVELMHQAGVPGEVLNFLPGRGSVIGPRLTGDPRIAGVAFTGSTDTAVSIHRALAARDGPIATLIAETGGQNVMIVDSSALPEQVVSDVLTSAFNSAGQRCSALRVLFVQDDIAEKVIDLLRGAMAELYVGDPGLLSTDVGPVIDARARDELVEHIAALRKMGRVVYETPLGKDTRHGSFVPPCAFEIDALDQLHKENFGPLLHVIRYAANRLEQIIEAINATGYGLTLGIHSRIEDTAAIIRRRVRVGNIYVNRNMIGAVVGVQPFGGEGLSGTGPKAGGPHYLHRFACERTYTVNTAAVGGNASLFSLDE